MEPERAPTGVPPHQQAAEDVVAAHRTHAEHGLQEAEAESRLARDGANELTADAPVAPWRRFLAQFEDVLVLLLLVATALSAVLWLVERESALPYEAMAILAVVLLNAVMGYIQESRAEAAVAARGLSSMLAERSAASIAYGKAVAKHSLGDPESLLKKLELALFAGKIAAYSVHRAGNGASAQTGTQAPGKANARVERSRPVSAHALALQNRRSS